MDEEFAALFLPNLSPNIASPVMSREETTRPISKRKPQSFSSDENGPLDESQGVRQQRFIQNPVHTMQQQQLNSHQMRRDSELNTDVWTYPENDEPDEYSQRRPHTSHYSYLIPAEAASARTTNIDMLNSQDTLSQLMINQGTMSPMFRPLEGARADYSQPSPFMNGLSEKDIQDNFALSNVNTQFSTPSLELSNMASSSYSPLQLGQYDNQGIKLELPEMYGDSLSPMNQATTFLPDIMDNSESPQTLKKVKEKNSTRKNSNRGHLAETSESKKKTASDRLDSYCERAEGLDLLNFTRLPNSDYDTELLDRDGNVVNMSVDAHILGRFFWNAKNWDLVDPTVGLSTCPIACYRRNAIMAWCVISFSGLVHSVRITKNKTEEGGPKEMLVELDSMRLVLHASSSITPGSQVEINILTDKPRLRQNSEAGEDGSPEPADDEVKMTSRTVDHPFYDGSKVFVARKVQFRKATPNNVKNTSRSFYYMFLTLVGVDKSTKRGVHLFTMTTNPITVRGRNPSFYTEYNDILITKDLVHHLKMEVPLMLQHLKSQRDTNGSQPKKRKAEEQDAEASSANIGKPLNRMSVDLVTNSKQYQYFPISSAYYLPPIQVYYFPHSSAHNERKPTSLPIFKRSTSQTQPVSAASLLNTIGNGRLPRKSFKSQGYFSSSEGRQRMDRELNGGSVIEENAIEQAEEEEDEDDDEEGEDSRVKQEESISSPVYSGSQSITYKYFLKPETGDKQ